MLISDIKGFRTNEGYNLSDEIFIDSLKFLSTHFDVHQIKWVIVGGAAVQIRCPTAPLRSTLDIDILMGDSTISYGTFKEQISSDLDRTLRKKYFTKIRKKKPFYEIEVSGEDGIKENRPSFYLHFNRNTRDIFIQSVYGELLKKQMINREMFEVNNFSVPVERKEDILAFKISSSRPKDIYDLHILAEHDTAPIDCAYLIETLNCIFNNNPIEVSEAMNQLEGIFIDTCISKEINKEPLCCV